MPITASHLAPQGGGFEPQRVYDFDVELYGIPGAGTISLAIQAAGLPHVEVGQIELHMGAERRKVAGLVNYPNIEITVVDYIDENTYGLLLAWSRLVYNPESGTEGYASQYKKQGAIILVGPDGARSRSYQLEGVWPTRVTPDGLDYSNEDKLKVSIELSVDLATPQF